MIKRIALLGWSVLKRNAELSVDTVEKVDGLYLHVEIVIFGRVLINEYFIIDDFKASGEGWDRRPIDINYNSAEAWENARRLQKTIIKRLNE